MLNNSRNAALVILLGLFVRLFYVLAVPQLSLSGSDAIEYDITAVRFLEGHGFPVERLSEDQVEIVRPPLFPLILAGIYKAFGHNYTFVRLLQALLAAVTALFIYILAKDIFRSKSVGLLSCLLYSLYPSLIAYTGLLYSETVFTFFLVISMYFLMLCLKSGRTIFFGLTGLFLALATMISSRSLYMVVFIAAALLILFKNKKTALKGSAIIILVMAAVFSPWTIRNYFVSGGKFILLESYSSQTALWLATNPQGQILEWSYDREPLKSLVGHLPVSQRTPVIRREAIKNLKKYPLAYLRNSVKRFFVLLVAGHSNCFSGFEHSLKQDIAGRHFVKAAFKAGLLFFNTAVIFLGFMGIWLFRKEWRRSIVLLIPVAYTVLLHTFYVAAPRLQMPMVPFLLAFSSYALIRKLPDFKNKPITNGDAHG